jgi:polysaccharide export outer membrane protein
MTPPPVTCCTMVQGSDFKIGVSRLLAAILLGATALLSGGCKSPAPTGPVQDMKGGQTAGTLAPGDTIQITYSGAPDLNTSQRIRSDGKISLRHVGEVQAAGRTPSALQAYLSQAYQKHLKDTEILVVVGSSTLPVYVTGAVNRPGKIVLDRPMTVLEAIVEAGGYSEETANLKKVRITRTVDGKHTTRVVDLRDAFAGKTTDSIPVRGYDIIHVSGDWL